MDWSLVLVSQGIDAVIQREENSWKLVVQQPDYGRAIQAIDQYRLENQRKPWIQALPWTGLIFDWRAAAVVLFLILIYAIEATGHGDLRRIGAMDNRAVHAGQWWRVFTAVTLHGDIPHLAANASTGLLLLGLALGAFGPGFGLLASLLAGVAGNLVGLMLYPEIHRGLGASGMVMGALGLLAAHSVVLLRHGLTQRQLAIRAVASACLLLVLLGFNPAPNVDVVAHVTGFLAGFGLGGVTALFSMNWLHSRTWNWVTLGASAAVVFVPWQLAIRSVAR